MVVLRRATPCPGSSIAIRTFGGEVSEKEKLHHAWQLAFLLNPEILKTLQMGQFEYRIGHMVEIPWKCT